jgi:hypothetical protein
MIGETYPFLNEDYILSSDTMFYTFLSVSEDMVIPKVIVYSPIDKNEQRYYNLGFGDLEIDPTTRAFRIDDKNESNNGDVKTVFYTVVSTLTDFFERYPEGTVHIEGSTAQRMDVYRGLIARHWRQIEPTYIIRGYDNKKLEVFQAGIPYEYVLISRKETLNLESLMKGL